MSNAPVFSSEVITAKTLRRAVGILGIALPVAVFLGALIIFQSGVRGSISGYYHTGMRDVFVGVLWATGIFLLCYRGYEKIDDRIATWAGVFAVCVSLFPTTHDDPVGGGVRFIGTLHLLFAAAFFLLLSFMSLKLFTKSDLKVIKGQKRVRNLVYVNCAYILFACVVLMAIVSFLPPGPSLALKPFRLILVLETVALWAFGFSWLIKGETLWQDAAKKG
jgi:hypothetical protein